MAGIENFRVKKGKDQIAGLFGSVTQHEKPLTPEQTRTAQAEELFKRLWSLYLQELDRQAENRFQQSVDADYYDHIQWSEEDVRVMEERGQVPRVYNKIKPAVDWILGTEKRNRVDWKILPRQRQAMDSAQAKTDVLKYVSDANHVQYVRSRAFADAVKVGIGWLTESMEDGDDGEPLVLDYESWRNMLHDSANPNNDINRGRYVIRTKWCDLDIANAMFPGHAGTLESSIERGFRVGGGQDSDDAMDSPEFSRENYGVGSTATVNLRDRVRLVEIWYKVPAKMKFIKASGEYGHLNKERFNDRNPDHAEAQKSGLVSVVERMQMQTRVAILCSRGLLFDAASPYRHNKFPFTPIWGYRRDRDNMPYGIVRGIRDPQDDLNKRISKALHILSTNKVIMDKGAVDDINEFIKEVSRPDGVLIKNPGKEIILNTDRDLAASHMVLMEMDAQMIQDSSGITDENMGRQTNASSGRAIVARQDQGALATAELFDNLRLAIQISGEKTLSLVEQYYTEQKDIRLTDNKGNTDWRTVNDGMPENDIARTKADFIVSQQEFRDSMMLAAQEQLQEMIGAMPPEIAIQFMDLVVEMLPLPNKDEFVKRLKKLSGQVDPNEQVTPEEQAEREAAAKAQQAQNELMMRGAAAEVGLKEAQAQKTALEGAKIEQELQMPAQMGIDPESVQQVVQENQQLQQQLQMAEVKLANKQEEIAQRHHTAVTTAHIAAQAGLAKQQMSNQAAERQNERSTRLAAAQADQQAHLSMAQQERDHTLQMVQQDREHGLQREQTDAQRKFEEKNTAGQREHEAKQSDAQRKHDAALADKQMKAQAAQKKAQDKAKPAAKKAAAKKAAAKKA